jgi:hypothetical protein
MRWNTKRDDDTITRGELRSALSTRMSDPKSPVQFNAYYTLESLVDAVFNYGARPKSFNQGAVTVITQAELAEALANEGWADPFARAGRIITHALGRRTSPYNPQVNGEEAITKNELNAALNRIGYTSDLHGDGIFADIMAHREPEWHAGDVVKDNNDVIWTRRSDTRWNTPGSTVNHSDSALKRPLKRMVEESLT